MNFIFHHIWDVILPIDELHHCSTWLLHHQPDIYSVPSGYLTWQWKITMLLIGKPSINGPFPMAMLVYETFGSPKPHTRRLQDIFQDGVTIPAFQQAISQSPFGLGAAANSEHIFMSVGTQCW